MKDGVDVSTLCSSPRRGSHKFGCGERKEKFVSVQTFMYVEGVGSDMLGSFPARVVLCLGIAHTLVHRFIYLF